MLQLCASLSFLQTNPLCCSPTHSFVCLFVLLKSNVSIFIAPSPPFPLLQNRTSNQKKGWEDLGVLTRCYDDEGKPADTGPL